MGIDVNRYYRSFSGADSLAFIMLPQTKPILLGSLSTISYSIYRDKKPVPLIGRINVGGFTRGTRVVAGTMIFTLINQHWVNDLLNEIPWLKKFGKLKADELPLFDIMIISANEYGASVQMIVYGVDITDEGQVLSIEDLFTENQFSFIARDIETFSVYVDNVTKTGTKTKIQTINSFNLNNNKNKIQYTNYTPIKKTNVNVLEVQQMLKNKGYNVIVNGIYDNNTMDAIKRYQADVGIKPTGIIDEDTVSALYNNAKYENKHGIVLSKYPVPVYEKPTINSNMIMQLGYNENVKIKDDLGEWLQIEKDNISGYTQKNNIYYGSNVDKIDLPTLRLNSVDNSVILLKETLNKKLGVNLILDNKYDYDTYNAVKTYQRVHKIPDDGVVDDRLWGIIKEEGINEIPIVKTGKQEFKLEFITIPGIYKDNINTINLNNYGVIINNLKYNTTFKLSCIMHYNNNAKETIVRDIEINKNNTPYYLTLNQIEESILFETKYNSFPYRIDFIIFNTDINPIKYTINLQQNI